MTVCTPINAAAAQVACRGFPVDREAESISQRLIEAAHANDSKSATELLSNPFVDVNYMGTVLLKARKTEVVLHDEDPCQVRVDFEEFKTEVTTLFLAAHHGNIPLLRKLLSAGANVNQKMFRGYATTAAVREGHIEVLKMLISGGATQNACEEALLEACYLGRARPAELLMASDMVRPHVAVHALVTASFRGFQDFVDTLIKSGVDRNATARVLLQSSKPSLHANVDCNPLAAAILGRQISVVQLLLQVGVRTDVKVRLGAWSWDAVTGEEFRVGACLAEPYPLTWCAVEFYESSSSILRMLLQCIPPNRPHLGRRLIHHAILCGNASAVEVLLSYGADAEAVIKTKQAEIRPIHMASRSGLNEALRHLIEAGCNPNSTTETGDTALMISSREKNDECLKLLAAAGADLGLTNLAGQSAMSIAGSVRWALGFQQAVLDVIRAGNIIDRSSNAAVFSALTFATQANDIEALKNLLKRTEMINLNEQNENGFSAVMVAAASGNVEAFKLLVHAGADVKLPNRYGETAINLSEKHQNSDAFEKVMLNYLRSKGELCYVGSSTLHRAAHNGDTKLVRLLIGEGYDVNLADCDGYTPLMLAARTGNRSMCEVLISYGARCDAKNGMHETALSLARKNSNGRDAEMLILDELARALVVGGAHVKKHTKRGKGRPHGKLLKMVATTGVLRWGRSRRRNVICRGAEVGPSQSFRWNRRKKKDADDPGVFRVITARNKEVHFVCEGGKDMAELWVRGIGVVTREAIFGKKSGELL